MNLLDSVLLAHPGQVPGNSEIGYYIEPLKYESLQESLNHLAQDLITAVSYRT